MTEGFLFKKNLEVWWFSFFTSCKFAWFASVFVHFWILVPTTTLWRYQKLTKVRYMCYKGLCKNTKTLTEAFLRFCYFCSSFWRPFPLCISKLGWLPPYLVTVCAFVNEIYNIETSKLNKECENIFQRNMRKEIENSPKQFWGIANCVPPIRRHFPYLSYQIGPITA